MKTIPDFGVNPNQLSSPDIDSAELAARLGINKFRRSGRVVYMDSCDSLSSWQAETSGAGASITVDSTKSYDGGNSFHLVVGTDLSKLADIFKNIPALSFTSNFNTKVGIEFYYRAATYAGNQATLELSCIFDPVEGLYASQNKLRFNLAQGSIDYWNGTSYVGVTLPLHSIYSTFKYGASRYGPYMLPFENLGSAIFSWHNIKAVFEFGKYDQIYFDGITVPVSAPLSLTVLPSPTLGYGLTLLKWLFQDLSNTGPSALWIDNIIVTMDEP